MASPKRVAVGQLCSTSDTKRNFERIRHLAEAAAKQECSLLSLPECCCFLGERSSESLAISEPISGPTIDKYRTLARNTGLWLSLGGFQETGPDPEHIYNTHVVIDDRGEVMAQYRKMHLFSYEDAEHGVSLDENGFTKPGSDVVVCKSPVGRLGLTVCYDVRFPQLYQRLRFDHGAEVLLVPSAFTVPTGKAHWEVLLRARAIETQCYVLAAAQTNRHNPKRESYGHSMAIDPWGKVIFDLGTEEDAIGVVDIDAERLTALRSSLPLDRHRQISRSLKE